MNGCASRAYAYTGAIFGRGSHFTSTSSCHQCYSSASSGFKSFNLGLVLKIATNKFSALCYSTQRSSSVRAYRKRKSEPESTAMDKEKDAFFVVRKGDVVGVYRSLIDCQAQVGSSVCDPPVSVYKGYSLPKDTQDYLVARGLQNALYTIKAEDLKEDLFGTLVPCPFQQPAPSKGETSGQDSQMKRSQEFLELKTSETHGSVSGLTGPLGKHPKFDNQTKVQTLPYDSHSCILEFDGASRGNPGPAGAGALLRTTDGRIICRLREGLGQVTNNVAEYRAMILGLKYALRKGYTKICVQGDSKLVCSQVQGLWKVKHKDMATLYEQAKQLKDKFVSFEISHVLRDLNSEADKQANLAIQLADGQVQEDCG